MFERSSEQCKKKTALAEAAISTPAKKIQKNNWKRVFFITRWMVLVNWCKNAGYIVFAIAIGAVNNMRNADYQLTYFDLFNQENCLCTANTRLEDD